MRLFNLFRRRPKAEPTPAQTPAPERFELPPVSPLQFIFEDSRGVKWYQYENPLQAPAYRVLMIQEATRIQEMCMTKKQLKSLCERAISALTENNKNEAVVILAEIKFRNEFLYEEAALMQLAAAFIVTEDEDSKGFNSAFQDQKIKRWQENKADYDFFLRVAISYLAAFNDCSEQTIQTYLQQSKELSQMLSDIIIRKK